MVHAEPKLNRNVIVALVEGRWRTKRAAQSIVRLFGSLPLRRFSATFQEGDYLFGRVDIAENLKNRGQGG